MRCIFIRYRNSPPNRFVRSGKKQSLVHDMDDDDVPAEVAATLGIEQVKATSKLDVGISDLMIGQETASVTTRGLSQRLPEGVEADASKAAANACVALKASIPWRDR